MSPQALRSRSAERTLLSFGRLALAAVLLLSAGVALALPPGFVQTDIASGWSGVSGLTFSADGSKLYVVERGGTVWIVDTATGVKNPTPFMDISDEVGGWRDFGLLGFALHPNFDNNHYVYALYSVDHHHLLYYGTPSYDPGLLEHDSQTRYHATISRITRWEADPATNYETVDLSTRTVFVGETIDDGIPQLHQSHGTGQLIFGEDGTLLGSIGDGASYSSTDVGSAGETYYQEGLNLGIIEPWENVGAWRSQMIDSYNGNMLRLDPVTGFGVPSNPWFDPANPASVRSRTFAIGLRNSYRFTHRPGTGSPDPRDGDPGSFYIGNVAWGSADELFVLNGAGQNFGWPAYEGLYEQSSYQGQNTQHPLLKNPLFGTGGCTEEFIRFESLIIQTIDTTKITPSWPNPCNAGQQIPDTWTDPSDSTVYTYLKFIHRAPPVYWRANAAVTVFNPDGTVTHEGIPGTKVSGNNFSGNASTGGKWADVPDFPSKWRNSYFHAEYGGGWIKSFGFDENDEPFDVLDFLEPGNNVTFVDSNPATGGIYYVKWGDRVREIRFVGPGSGTNPPEAVAEIVPPGTNFGPEGGSGFQVQFRGDNSIEVDPGDTLSYLWDFDDSGATSAQANPTYAFDPPGSGVATGYRVRLTVTDDDSQVSDAELIISVNNTPPTGTIVAPGDGALYDLSGISNVNVSGSATDLEHSGAELSCDWVVEHHHDSHVHTATPVAGCDTQVQLLPAGCDLSEHFYRVKLVVTDDALLAHTSSVDLFPDCSTLPSSPPMALDDFADVPQGHASDIDVLVNDVDIDGTVDPTTVAVVTSPQHGNTSVNPTTGIITYTHDGLGSVQDEFEYTVDDDSSTTSNAASVFITAFNTPPMVTLTSPGDASLYADGQYLVLSALVDDAEDGSALTHSWEIQAIQDDQLLPAVMTDTTATPPLFQTGGHGQPASAVSYIVKLTVTDQAGDTASAEARVNPVSPPAGNLAPTASFNANPAVGLSPLSVAFDASASSDPEGDYLSYVWDFGDGSTGQGAAANHDYASSGNYAAQLTVTDAAGHSDQASVLIEATATGLEGRYYNNWAQNGGGTLDLTGPPDLVRIDSQVAFGWDNGSPDPSIANDNFGIRWDGQVRPLYSESYQFYTYSDDGVRLWVDGQLLVDHWEPQGPTERTGPTISLTAGVWYDIVLEYFENGGGAVAELRWSSPSQGKETIPSSVLAPPTSGNVGPVAVPDGGVVSPSGSVIIDVLANDLDAGGEIDPSSVVVQSGPGAGTTSIDVVTGAITYTHTGGAVASDQFFYTVEGLDGRLSNQAAVDIAIAWPTPTAEITSPTEGADVPGVNIQVDFSIAANAASYDHVHVLRDGYPIFEHPAGSSSAPLAGLGLGAHTVLVQLVDASHVPLPNPGATAAVGFNSVPVPVCGNGAQEVGEECDDGNTTSGDCCSSTCSAESFGNICSDDGNTCTQDHCDGVGACIHPIELDGTACADGDACTELDSCVAGICSGAPLPNNDGDALCDALDDDDDNDGRDDGLDSDPFDPFQCADTDVDGCEDCSSGTFDPAADGPDFDTDGICEPSVSVVAAADNTLYEDASGATSNGSGEAFFAGTTNSGAIRRGLVRFDIAAAVPPGSTIHDAQLTLHMSRTIADPKDVGVHAVTVDWGQGASDAPGFEGGGTAAQTGDATWLHSSWDTMLWSSAGGDYSPTASATTSVGVPVDFYSWSSSGLAADIQGWLDNPGTNFGWAVVGDETTAFTSKRFDSSENPTPGFRPQLWVHFSPPTPTWGACCQVDGSCGFSVDAPTCGGAGGTYEGDGTICSPNPCPQPTGACCGSDGTCSELTQEACESGGGAFTGNFSTCTPDLCAITYLEPFVDPLPIPAVAMPTAGTVGSVASYEIAMQEVHAQLHRDLAPSTLWAYDGTVPGPTIEATAGDQVTVSWINDLRDGNGDLRTEHFLPVDLCPHGPNHAGPTPRTVVHLHGAHVKEEFDGYPEYTSLPGGTDVYEYPNFQLPSTLWYHDHALGITRLNVYLGLAGFYLIRDSFENSLGLPSGEYEIPLMIMDRSFNSDGELRYPAQWQDTFFGDHNLVNGKVAPYLNVKQGKYRFRMLNAANSRAYTLSLSNGMSFQVIGTDGGLLPAPVAMNEITLTGAERADVIIDFSGLPAGTEVVLTNSAPAPILAAPGTNATPDVMKFIVQNEVGFTAPIPSSLRPIFYHDEADAVEEREFYLEKAPDACTGFTWLINGLHWDDITEFPELGTTEVWNFINKSGMVHPMHMHLVMFHVLDRQMFDLVDDVVVPIGSPTPPAPHESGWKDTIPVYPNEMVRVIARFEDYTGKYAYHCHVIEHEDQEMMRQFQVVDNCGNGAVGPAEQCDDGNTLDGDCCSSTCTFEAIGSLCQDDGSVCTQDLCDGAGVCDHAALADGTGCDDGQLCTVSDECTAGVCGGTDLGDNDGDQICDPDDVDDDNDGLLDTWEAAVGLNVYAADSDADGVDDGAEVSVGSDPANGSELPTPPLTFQAGSVPAVTNAGWTTVSLDATYASMVVVATPVYDETSPPLVTRIQNAAGGSFDVRVDRVDGVVDPIAAIEVEYFVVEEGVYTRAAHGITMEAIKFLSTVTDENTSWVGESRSYLQAYTQPVVLGQVMTYNDPASSVFWAGGVATTSPPTSGAFLVGKHVGEDPNIVRADETLGYVVIESGEGRLGWQPYASAVGDKEVIGVSSSALIHYTMPPVIGGIENVVLSSAGIRGRDGSWPVLTDLSNPASLLLFLGVDEDLLGDAERYHVMMEHVSYLALGDTPKETFWNEQGDAVAYPPGTSGQGLALAAILGTYSTNADVDVYGIHISDPALFSARTLGPEDSSLFLLQVGGEGVAANSDDGGVSAQAVLPVGDPLLGSLSPGRYLLAVAQEGLVPMAGANPIFAAELSGAAHGPVDPGPVDSWSGGASGGATGYALVLTGAVYVPEPGGLVLLAAGGVGLACLRRLRGLRHR